MPLVTQSPAPKYSKPSACNALVAFALLSLAGATVLLFQGAWIEACAAVVGAVWTFAAAELLDHVGRAAFFAERAAELLARTPVTVPLPVAESSADILRSVEEAKQALGEARNLYGRGPGYGQQNEKP